MTDTSREPLKVVGFVDDAVRGKTGDRIVLPLRLNRLPTEYERRASVARDAVGHLSTDTLELRFPIHGSTDIKSAVDIVRSTLAIISSEALKLESQAAQDAQNRSDGTNAAADEIRAALRDAGLPPLDD